MSSKSAIIKLLNYSIDFGISEKFIASIQMLADFEFLIKEYGSALFYYNECRICATKMDRPRFAIQSLIKMAECCEKAGYLEEGVAILKKALECAWYYRREEEELLVYDKIAKLLYLNGNPEEASKYYTRYVKPLP